MVPDVLTRVTRANMNVISLARRAARVSAGTQETQDLLWRHYWRGGENLALELPAGPMFAREAHESGLTWEYLIEGRLDPSGTSPLTNDREAIASLEGLARRSRSLRSQRLEARWRRLALGKPKGNRHNFGLAAAGPSRDRQAAGGDWSRSGPHPWSSL